VYHWRTTLGTSRGPVELAFTDRRGGAGAAHSDELDLALEDGAEGRPAPGRCTTNLLRVAADLAPGADVADMRQVHGGAVAVVGDESSPGRPEADGLVTAEPGRVLVVRVADCLPVLLVDRGVGVIGAVHAGRRGLVAGVVPAAVDRMRDLGATEVGAWLGPRICGACYEVPEALQAEVGAVVPEAVATTSWGTPSLDIGAGVRAQLASLDVPVVDVATCTRESADLWSYRRDGVRAGRFAGLVWRRGNG
jgi:YfiH family protein